jgi:hypothetical protein
LALADAQGFSGRAQLQTVAVYPDAQHFMADLARLFFGPVANAVCSERFVEPKDAVAPRADTGWCENH